jgi:hypothetical protein
MSAIANQKFNQLFLNGYQPTRMQESEDLAPYNAPCQQKAAKETNALPQFLISATTLIIIKEKMGE